MSEAISAREALIRELAAAKSAYERVHAEHAANKFELNVAQRKSTSSYERREAAGQKVMRFEAALKIIEKDYGENK